MHFRWPNTERPLHLHWDHVAFCLWLFWSNYQLKNARLRSKFIVRKASFLHCLKSEKVGKAMATWFGSMPTLNRKMRIQPQVYDSADACGFQGGDIWCSQCFPLPRNIDDRVVTLWCKGNLTSNWRGKSVMNSRHPIRKEQNPPNPLFRAR